MSLLNRGKWLSSCRRQTLCMAVICVLLANAMPILAQEAPRALRFTPVTGEAQPLYPQSTASSPTQTSAVLEDADDEDARIHYSVNAAVARLVVELDRDNLPADGQSPTRVTVNATGEDGLPVKGEVFATVESSGGRVQLDGAGTDEFGPGRLDADRATPGVQLKLVDGKGSFLLLAPHEPQDVLLRVTSGDQTAQGVVSYLPELRDMLAVGLLEGIVAFNDKSSGLLSPPRTGDGFEQDMRRWENSFNDGKANAAARAAFFVKGTVKDDYLLTVAYDSDKETRARLLQDVNPDDYYPVYGDASLRGFDARSADRLYMRVDRNRSYLMYGDFQTGDGLRAFTGVDNEGMPMRRSLGLYNRSATGAAWHYESPRLIADVFAFEDSLRQVIEEFPSQGSGPYGLRNNAVYEGSERVEVIVRDRDQPSRIISVRPLARYVDYTFEVFSGRILLATFLPAFDENLNAVSLRVTYEVDQGTEKFWVLGSNVQFKVTDNFELGASYIDDQNPFASLDMASANMAWKMGKSTMLVGEWAQTRSLINTNSVNQNASPGLQDLSGEVEGDAWRVEFAHDGDRFDASVFAGQSDPAFSNQAAPLYGGRGEYRIDLDWRIGKDGKLYVEGLRTEDRNPDGGDRTAAGAGARFGIGKALTIDFGLRTIRETVGAYSPWSTSPPFGDTVGLQGSNLSGAGGGALGYGQQPLDPLTGLPIIYSGNTGGQGMQSNLPLGTELESNTVRLGLGLKLTDRLRLGGEVEQDISGEERNRYALGADYQVQERNRVYARYERETGLSSLYGITSNGIEADNFVVGVDSTYLRDTQLFSEYRLRDSISGRDAQAANGVRNLWEISEGLRLNTAVEFINVISGDTGDATGISFGLDYTRNPLWRASTKLEFRRSGDVPSTDNNEEFDTWLWQGTFARKLDRDWTFLVRNYLLKTEYDVGGEVFQDRFQLGMAYRDTDTNRVNALMRYEYKVERDTSGPLMPTPNGITLPDDVDIRAHIVSAHADWHPSRPWWLTGRIAGKWQDDVFGQEPGENIESSFRGVLLSGRVVYDVTEKWDIGVLASTFQGDYGSNQYAYGFEVGRVLRQNLWLSFGYNWTGFEADPDLSGYEYTQQGGYIRLRFKFDEDLFTRDPYRQTGARQ